VNTYFLCAVISYRCCYVCCPQPPLFATLRVLTSTATVAALGSYVTPEVHGISKGACGIGYVWYMECIRKEVYFLSVEGSELDGK